MLRAETDFEKLTEIFPYLETVLNFGTYTRNIRTKKVYWSPGLYHILGTTAEKTEPTIKNFTSFISEEDLDMVNESARKQLELLKTQGLEFSIVDGHGNHKRIYAETFFKTDDDGKLLEYAGIVKDITENYEYKRALEEKVAQLDKSNKDLQEFAYVASHDLQEPVRKISTFAERLGSKYGNSLGEEGNMYLRRMQNSSRNMQTLLDDLLNFSRLSFNDKPLEKIPLIKCVENVISDFEVTIEETGAKIEYGELPFVEGYFTQLKQLFYNLIGNGIKFRKPGEAPHIVISSTRVNPYSYPNYPLLKNTHYARIDITDNGIGFEQEYAERIFMIFQRLNSRAEYTGSGIGLSICKKIAENHHGVIFASGAPDKGSTFTVLLPYTIG